jgi:hypothetical protein
MMSTPLEYASLRAPRQRWYRHPVLFACADAAAILFPLSQLAFMFDMMITNINECSVPPYGFGSSYNSHALGNADFVRAFPRAAAWIIHGSHNSLCVLLSFPSLLANAFTFTSFSWIIAGYLVLRIFATHGYRRTVICLAAIVMLATLPWIWWTLIVFFD